MKWIKETKGKRQAAIGTVFLVVFLSLVMALSCAEFYKRYKEQVIHTEESQLLTIAGIIGNNLDMFLNEQLEQIDLFYSSENGLLGEKMQMNRKISYFLDKNEKLYNWIRLICPDGRQILYKAGTELFTKLLRQNILRRDMPRMHRSREKRYQKKQAGMKCT